jgi:repressor LexA
MVERGLTERQRSILGFLKDFILENGYPPSLREVCEKFGISGPNNAAKHLDALERKGFIRRLSKASRAIEVFDSPVKRAVSIPIAGHIKAGPPHLAIEDVTGHVTLDAAFFNCKDAFLLKVEGESMIGAGIDEGDYLIVKPQSTASNNDIVVAVLDEEATVKRFLKKGDAITLKPENPDLEPIHVKKTTPFSIIGRVIFTIKPLG